MDAVNWQKLCLPIDPNLVGIRKPSVRGINCEEIGVVITTEQMNQNHGAMQTKHNTAQHIDDKCRNGHINTFIVALLSVMCGVMLAFFILFVILNRGKIYNRFGGTAVIYSTDGTPSQTREYSNTELLIRE